MDKIGKYEILGKLGEGGMGVVYKALDPLLERIVALKTIAAHLDSEPDLRARFFREGRSAAQLSHKNIITVYDLGEDDGRAYLALEYLEGEDLKERIRKQEFPSLAAKLKIINEICEGLAHAHHRKVIHRDIKPANVFITRAGQVKILDFGLARLMSGETTRSGIMRGSPNYMSPEQVRGVETDHRSDIFSAGALFYELLTSRKPFAGETITATIGQILYHDPEPPDRIDPSIDVGLAAVIMKSLLKDPEARYQDVDELLADLKACTGNIAAMDASAVPAAVVVGPASSSYSGQTGSDDLRTQYPKPEKAAVLQKPGLFSRYALAATLLLLAGTGIAWWMMHPGARTESDSTKLASAATPSTRQELTASPTEISKPPAALQDAAVGTSSTLGPSPPPPAAKNAAATDDAGRVASGNRQTRELISRGNYPEASASLKKVLQIAPSDPEARRLAAQLAEHERQNANEALQRMAQSRSVADQAGAAEYATHSYQAALKREGEARDLYAGQKYGDAAAASFEASGLYSSAALEAASEKKARETQALLNEQARQKDMERGQAESSRNLYEQERLEAAKAGAETQASAKYQEATQLALSARSRWDQQDFAAARSGYEKAAQAMGLARTQAETARKPQPPEPPPAAEKKQPAAPALPTPEADLAAVRTLLDQYANALRSRDINLIHSIWPGLRSEQERALSEDFRNARQIDVRFADVHITVTGDTAVVTALRTYLLESVDGQRPQIETRMTMNVSRNGKSWLIDTIRFEPLQEPNSTCANSNMRS